jgi:DNA-binding transcriptional ArsR family regulator
MEKPMRKQLDPRSLHGLAHPLRVRLLAELRAEGPATATMLAARTGESSGATSYHLRELARHGFIAEDRDRGRGRERWWRAQHDYTVLLPSRFQDAPEERELADELLRRAVARRVELLTGWLDERADYDPAWLDSGFNDGMVHVSPTAAQRLVGELFAVVERYRTGELAAEEGAERVALFVDLLPQRGAVR